MAPLDQLSIRIGLDPVSVKTFLAQIEALKAQVIANPLVLPISSTAPAALAGIGAAAGQAAATVTVATTQMARGLAQVQTVAAAAQKQLIGIKGALIGIGGVLALTGAVEESRNLARANVILQFTTEELASAQEQLRDVAARTNFSFQDVSASLFDVASAGFEGAKAVDAVTAAAVAAAPAGIDVATAFNAIATAQANFSLTSEEAADILVRTADVTRGTLADVSNALGRIGPVAGQFGISIQEVGAAFALITQRGVSGAEATTQLFNVINTFLAPADEAATLLNQIGIVTGEAAFQTQDLAAKFRILRDRASEIGGLGEVFNIRGFRGAAALSGSVEQLGGVIDDITDSAGRAKKGLEDFARSGGPQFDRLITQIGQLLVSIGTNFLDALSPVIKLLGDFLQANRDLLAVLGAVALSVAASAGALFLYRGALLAARGAATLIAGVINIITGATLRQTGALIANTQAWLTNALSRAAAVVGGILSFLAASVVFILRETAGLLTNTRAWAANTLARTAAIVRGFLVFIARTVAALLTEIQFVGLDSKAWAVNTRARLAADAAGKNLTKTLNANVFALGKTTVALGALAAVAVGAAIGTAANELFGLEDAAVKAAKGLGLTTGETIKANVATLGLVNIWAGANAEMRRVNETLGAVQAQILKTNAAVSGKFDFLKNLAPDASDIALFNAAVGSLEAELGFLNRLQLSEENREQVKKRIAEIENQIAARLNGQVVILSRLQQIERGRVSLQEVLKTTQAEFLSITQKVQTAFERINLGKNLADGIKITRAFTKDFEVLIERAAALSREIVRSKNEIRSGFLTGDLKETDKEFERITAVIVKAGKDLDEVNDVLVKSFDNARKQILAISKQEVSDLRKAKADEKAILQKAADEQIKIEQERVKAITAEINKLKDARADAIKTVQDFIDQLNLAEIRRKDTALASIVELEKRFNETIAKGLAEEQRAAALTALTKELERLSKASQIENDLRREQLKLEQEIQETAKEATDADVVQQQAQLAKLQTQIAEQAALRAERVEEAARVEAEAAANAQRAVTALLAQQKAQQDLEIARKIILEDIKIIEDNTLKAKQDVTKELTTQIERVTEFARQQLKVIKNAQDLAKIINNTGITGFGFGGEQQVGSVTGAAQARLAKVLEEATTGQAEVAGELTRINLRSSEIAKEITAQNETLKTFTAELVALTSTVGDEFKKVGDEILIPATAEIAAELQTLTEGFVPLGTALDDLLSTTQTASETTRTFAVDATETLDLTSREVAANAAVIGNQAAELVAINARLDEAARLRTGGLD